MSKKEQKISIKIKEKLPVSIGFELTASRSPGR